MQRLIYLDIIRISAGDIIVSCAGTIGETFILCCGLKIYIKYKQ